MPQELPNLSGVATKDLVEQIGSGSYKASYINWSRTMELLRKNAPGWMVETIFSADGSVVHQAPNGGYLLIRFRHLDGTTTPEVPQAIMDHMNKAIPFDRITARDITDTHRRGTCMAAAFTFGLAYELWAKMPLESGYAATDEVETSPKAEKRTTKVVTAEMKAKPVETDPDAAKTEFTTLATSMGLCEAAIEDLSKKVKGNYEAGTKTLMSKDASFVEEMNKKFLAVQY